MVCLDSTPPTPTLVAELDAYLRPPPHPTIGSDALMCRRTIGEDVRDMYGRLRPWGPGQHPTDTAPLRGYPRPTTRRVQRPQIDTEYPAQADDTVGARWVLIRGMDPSPRTPGPSQAMTQIQRTIQAELQGGTW